MWLRETSCSAAITFFFKLRKTPYLIRIGQILLLPYSPVDDLLAAADQRRQIRPGGVQLQRDRLMI